MSKPRVRFSLRTLLMLVMLCGSASVLWRNWEPWALLRKWKTAEPGSHSMWPSYVAVSSDGSRVAVASENHVLHLFDLSTGKELWANEFNFKLAGTIRFVDFDQAIAMDRRTSVSVNHNNALEETYWRVL